MQTGAFSLSGGGPGELCVHPGWPCACGNRVLASAGAYAVDTCASSCLAPPNRSSQRKGTPAIICDSPPKVKKPRLCVPAGTGRVHSVLHKISSRHCLIHRQTLDNPSPVPRASTLFPILMHALSAVAQHPHSFSPGPVDKSPPFCYYGSCSPSIFANCGDRNRLKSFYTQVVDIVWTTC